VLHSDGFGLVGGARHGGLRIHRVHLRGVESVGAQVAGIQASAVDGHGAVEVDWQVARQRVVGLEFGDRVQQRLGAPDLKHRHHRRAAARCAALQSRAKLAQHIFHWVHPIAVGGLTHHRVGCRRWLGCQHERVVLPAQVAREKDAAPPDFQQDAGRAQDVAGAREVGHPALERLEGLAYGHGAKQLDAAVRVVFRAGAAA